MAKPHAEQNLNLDFKALFEEGPASCLVLSPDFTIVTVTDSYLKATMTRREDILGRHLFEVFPDNPDDPTADGVSNLRQSLERVLVHKIADTMAVQKYDIRRPKAEGGGFEERYWSPVNFPVFDELGNIQYIIHRVEDVTEFVKLRNSENERKKFTNELKTRNGQMEIEIHQRSAERVRLEREFELQSLIMRNMAEGVCMVRAADEVIVYVNPKFESMFGYEAGELRGKPVKILSGGRPAETQDTLEKIRRKGTATYELRNQKKDGTIVWCRATTSSFEHHKHGPVLVSVQTDITQDRKLAEERQRLEQEFESFFTLSLDMFCIAGMDGYFKRMNPVWQEVLGFSPKELCSRPILEFVHPDDRESTVKAIENQKGGGSILSFENRYLCKDGTYRWLSWKSVPINGEMYAAARNITQDKINEAELKRALNAATLYSSVLDESAIVAFTDVEGTITHVNQSFCTISGYERNELLGKNHRILNSGTHPPEFFTHLWKTISSGKNWRGEICNRAKNGNLFWVDTTINPSVDQNGKVNQYMSVRFDITQRKNAELKLLASAKMSSLGEMAGGIAHEINTPLATIRLIAEQLIKEVKAVELEGETFIEELRKVISTTDRVAKIIKGLRSFSRNSEGDPMAPASISQILEDTLELCREKFKYRSIEFRVNNVVDQKIECRSAQISQVLLNLLSNSYDAILDLEKKWIDISLSASDTHVCLAVTDSGTGIPAHIREKIMQPFFTTKDVGSGTGLGLSISKGIVEDHQGKLFLDPSKPNTCFVIELPIRQSDVAKRAA